MRSIKILFLISLISLSSEKLFTQDVEIIINKYLDSMGGIERLREWKTLKGTGKYIMLAQGNTEVPFVTWYKAPNKKRVEMIMNGQKAIYAFDGETSWFLDPLKGIYEPTFMSEQQAKNNRDNADEYAFIDYKKKFHKVEFLGTEQINDLNVYKIKLVRANSSESYHFFECNSGNEVKILLYTSNNSSLITTEILESDFRNIDWLVLPFSIETRINEKPIYKILIDEAEIDIPVNDSIFIMPPK